LALKHKPKIIISGTTAYPRILDFKKFYEISKKVGAYHVADISHIAGLVIAGLHPSPFPYADVVTMTTHKTLKGPRGAVIFMRKELEDKINKSVFPGFKEDRI
jgi:glycine hydroxymethyltransferase